MSQRLTWDQLPGCPQDFDWRGVYEALVQGAPNEATFVEVGTAFGRSAAFLAMYAAQLKKVIRVIAVDDYSAAKGATASYFRAAMHQCGFPTVELIKRSAVDAAELFADRSVYFVFLDADHSREATEAAIHAWLPKVTSGGVLAGHDYDMPAVAAAVHATLSDVRVVGRCFLVSV